MLIRGDLLPERLKKQVLNAYIYRWTTGNARREYVWRNIDGKPTIPLQTDEQWLADHAFHVTKHGELSLRQRHAEPACLAD